MLVKNMQKSLQSAINRADTKQVIPSRQLHVQS